MGKILNNDNLEDCVVESVPFWLQCGESFCLDCEYLDWERYVCLKEECSKQE